MFNCVGRASAGGLIIKRIQEVSASFGSASTTDTATITAIDAANSIVIPMGSSVAVGGVSAEALFRVEITNTTTITATRGAGPSTVTTWNAIVIEFEPSVIDSIQTGTINVVTSTTDTISAVSAKAMVFHLGTETDTSTSQQNSVRVDLASSTTVRGIRDSSLNNAVVGYAVVDPR